jgi:hypothetical protein
MLRAMKPARSTYLSITITFVVALIFYLVAYNWLTRRQTAKGPWQVVFTNTTAGVPELIISQARLGITNTHLHFAGETLSTQAVGEVVFDKPQKPVPFGELLYDDLMFMPGIITLDCFGHEVELSPRVLVLNRKTSPWKSHSTNVLVADAKLPAAERAKNKGGYRSKPAR